jgi:hypothetical protein
MKKVRLELDSLQVESFDVEPLNAWSRGTVEGLQNAAGFEADAASNIHTRCYTHCATACEGSCTCPSEAKTHCDLDSCNGTCPVVTVPILTEPLPPYTNDEVQGW